MATSLTDSPPRAPPVKYKTPLGTRWQKEKAAAERGAFEYPDDAKYVGPWVIGECVGKGASGHVKIARHRRTGQLAAVKILPMQPFVSSRTHGNANGGSKGNASAGGGGATSPEYDDAQMAKSEKQRLGIDREITMMKLMNHPNIMRIYDVYEGERELYLILEYVEGGELFDFLVNRGKLAPLEALGYFKQIVYGLNYAHTFSIIHRDLKPENILIHSLHPPLIKIADWGMAAFAPPTLQLETSCGSPHYASPEIVNGYKYTGTATDIWSCGVILYALLTGRLPFDDKNVRNLLAKVKLGRYEMPAFVDPLAKDLLSRMLVVDVNKRITMAEILAHPWLETATPGIIYVPAPPVTELAQPLPSALHIDRDLFESLCVIWGRHANFEAIKADLLSPAGQGTLAKAFYFLLHKHRERTMEEHGILMDVTDALNGSSGKVVTKQYSAPRARAKTLQITGRDSYAAVTGHRHHRQHMDPYNQHHRYAPQQQQSHLRSSRPAPVAPSGSRSRSRSRSPSPAPPTSPGLRQPVSVLPPMERVPSRPYPHPPSPAGPRPQRPRPTSSPPATLLTRGRPDFLSGPGNGPNSSGMRSTGAAGGSSHVHGHLPYRRMLPPMERTAAMMSSPGPSHATSTDPNTTAAAMSSLTVGTGPGTGMTLPRASIVSGPTATPYNSAIVSPQQPQLVQNQRVNPTGSTPVNVNPAATLSPPVIHAPIPVQATVAMSMGNGVGVVGGSGNGVVLPMIAAPRVQDEALQRTINYCASLVNGQAVSWNAIVAKEIEREREREKEKKEGRHEQAQVMMNEEFAKSRVALGDSLGSQVPSQSQLQQQHDEKMDVDTPKKGEDKENWDQQVSPTGIATASAAAAPAQSESGGLGFGSSVPMGREMGNTLNAEEGGGNVTPPKGKGKDGKTRPPALDFTTPPGNMSSKKLPNFSSLIGSPTSNANAIPMSPPPHSSTTAMLLGSPVVGEFKGWFSNLFHWKPHSFILHSVDDINETKREVVRLLEASGVAISFTGTFEDSSQPGQSQTPQLQQAQQEGWAPLKCRVDELYEGNSILQKQVKFKVEFSVGAGLGLAPGTGSFVGSPRNISSPMSPLASPLPYTPNTSSGPPSLSNLPISLPIPIPNRTKMNSTGMSIGLGQGENSPMQVVVALTLEKGALSGFKNVCTFLRSEWRLDGGLMVPVSPRSPKFGIMSGGSVNTSIEQRMLG